jgi:hypothetical protein
VSADPNRTLVENCGWTVVIRRWRCTKRRRRQRIKRRLRDQSTVFGNALPTGSGAVEQDTGTHVTSTYTMLSVARSRIISFSCLPPVVAARWCRRSILGLSGPTRTVLAPLKPDYSKLASLVAMFAESAAIYS